MAKKSKKVWRKFRVYFSQINQQMYEVDAHDHDQAAKRATNIWNHEHGTQYPTYIEEVEAGEE